MVASSKPRPLASILASALLTAAVGITVGLPQTTHADKSSLATWVEPTTQLGDNVVAEATLVRDAQAKSGWALQLRARNRGDAPQVCKVVVRVTEASGSEMSRVPQTPRLVWETTRSLTVAPHAEIVQRAAVSSQLAQKLDAANPAPVPPASSPSASKDVVLHAQVGEKAAAPRARSAPASNRRPPRTRPSPEQLAEAAPLPAAVPAQYGALKVRVELVAAG